VLVHLRFGRSNWLLKEEKNMSGFAPQLNTAARAFVTPAFEVIASATVITPRGNFIRITGNTTIETITVSPYLIGPLYVINTDSSVGVTGVTDNIALASTLTRYKLFVFVYDPSVSKWYPSNAS